MHIEVTAGGLKGRALWLDPARYGRSPLPQTAMIDELPCETDLPAAELIAHPRELALTAARELFRRFDWDANLDVLCDMQATLRR